MKKYIFILKYDNGKIRAYYKGQVEAEIKESEDYGIELNFTAIGKLKEPDPNEEDKVIEKAIQWYVPIITRDQIIKSIESIKELMKYGN